MIRTLFIIAGAALVLSGSTFSGNAAGTGSAGSTFTGSAGLAWSNGDPSDYDDAALEAAQPLDTAAAGR